MRKKWGKFQTKAKKSSKVHFYPRVLVTCTGEREISVVSGRVGIYQLLSVSANSKVFLTLGYVIKCTVNGSACTIDL